MRYRPAGNQGTQNYKEAPNLPSASPLPTWFKWGSTFANGQIHERKAHPGLRNQKDTDMTASLGSHWATNWSNWESTPGGVTTKGWSHFSCSFSEQLSPSAVTGRILDGAHEPSAWPSSGPLMFPWLLITNLKPSAALQEKAEGPPRVQILQPSHL